MSGRTLDLWPQQRIAVGLPSRSRLEVVEALLELAAGALALDAAAHQRVLDALIAREKTGSTAAGHLAIPHAKCVDVTTSVGALAVFPKGIDFNAVDGEKVHAVFMLLSPADAAAEHVTNLRWIATVARKPDFMRFLRGTKTPAEVVSLLTEFGTR